VQRNAACAHELGEDELCGCVWAVGWGGRGLPVGEGQKLARLHLGCGAFGAGEAVSDLHDYGGEAGCAGAGCVGAASVEVVNLPQQPADCADGGAEEALRCEVSTYWRRPNSEVNRIPVG